MSEHFLTFFDYLALIINVLYTIYLARLKTWSWGLGIVGAILTIPLYLHINSASLIILQTIYIIFFSYGWYNWKKNGVSEEQNKVRWMNLKEYILYILYTIILCIICIEFNKYMDSKNIYSTGIVTGITLMAIVMTIKEFLENWIVWIISDIYFTIIMFNDGLYGQTIQNFIFFITAVYGFYFWYKNSNK